MSEVASESTPLTSDVSSNNAGSQKPSDPSLRRAYVSSLLLIVVIALMAVFNRSPPSQKIIIEEPTASNTEKQFVASYRPVCTYYHNKDDSTPPRVIQTSLSQPSQPWSSQACHLADSETIVQLNVGWAPDAVLTTNFSTSTTLQSKPILGFGGAFTEATARNVGSLTASSRSLVMELLFGQSGLGYSLGRIPIHSCDFAVESYNFDNVPDDFDLKHFDIHHDSKNGMIDLIRHALNVSNEWGNDLKLYASPWSPPGWMKRPTWEDKKTAIHASKMTYSATPNCLRGELREHNSKYARAWAKYFSKYIQAYKDAGIDLFAVTVQNEPEFPAPWEACAYSPENMTDFVAYHLGPILAVDHPNVTIFGFDHNKDHVDTWMMVMLNGTYPSSNAAGEFIGGTAYHWYAGGMDRLLDGALGVSNLHRLRENLRDLNRTDDLVFGSEACHCPTTGYAGGDIQVYWSRAERYAHTILADLAAGSQGWVEWNLVLDSIGGPNHLGNLCEAPILAAPHRAINATESKPLPDFEHHMPMHGRIIGDERTREELNALGFPAKYLDQGIIVQPLYYYMGHISRHVRPGSKSIPGLVRQSLGGGEIFRPVGSSVAGGGENDLARDGIEMLLWPCEGSTRQQFFWGSGNVISVLGHDWLGNPTKSCIGRSVDKDLNTFRLGTCETKTAGRFELVPDNDETFIIKLLNHGSLVGVCLSTRDLRNTGGSYGPLGGVLVALEECSNGTNWKLDDETGTISTTYKGSKVCLTTGWPFLQMGAFAHEKEKTVVILNEAKDSANYALKDDNRVKLTGSIPPRSIQTVVLD